jgi:hypothetical protein
MNPHTIAGYRKSEHRPARHIKPTNGHSASTLFLLRRKHALRA